MKNIFRLTALALLVSVQASVGAYTGQTFMSPQSTHAHEPAADYTWHRTHHNHEGIGGRLVSRSFLQLSTNSAALGRYFGHDGSNVIAYAPTPTGNQISSNSLLASTTFSGQTIAGTITLKPTRQVLAWNLGYEQSLRFIHNDLFMTVNMPLVSARHNLVATVGSNEVRQTVNAISYGVLDYFSGKLSQSGAVNQAALTAGKFGGAHKKTGIAGLEVNLGWKFIRGEDYGLHGRVLAVVPTAPKVTGEFMFEPTLGGGRNWQAGLGLDGVMKMHHSDDLRVDGALSLEAGYQFANKEMRTVGVEDFDFGQYDLMGKVTAAGVFPAANVLNQRVQVTPGFRFDANLNLNVLLWEYLGFNAMYNCHLQEAESVKVCSWNNNQYGIVDMTQSYDSTTAFSAAKAVGTALLSSAQLNTKKAATPSAVVHKFGGGVAYHLTLFGQHDAMIGLNAGYEFAQNNAAPASWEVSLKSGLTF